MPTNSIGTGCELAAARATCAPNPPSSTCSSAVTMAPHSRAAWATASYSSGFRVDLRISDRHAQLVVALIADKNGERRGEGNFPAQRQPAGDAHHIGFGDAAGEKALGKLLLKFGAEGGFGQIGVEHHDVGIL